MKRFNKFIAFVLAIAIVLSGAILPISPVTAEKNDDIKFTEAAKDNLNTKIKDTKKVDEHKLFKDDDKVRVIVELDKKPALSVANDKKVAFSDFSESKKKEIEKGVLNEQKSVKNKIESKNIKMNYKNKFTVSLNGFSGEVKYKDIKFIEKIDNVKKVYISNEYNRPEPKMKNSGEMINTQKVWDLNYKGEEQVVAILDTGIDYTHKDMVLADDIKVALDKNDVENKDVLGKYFTKKVPYGYNYYDLNNEVIDKGPAPSMHGMHVGGTAGANGDADNGGIKGVAPHSQLLAMKVFSNDPIYATTFSDIYLVAIDESIKLGADVINMSLGSPSGFYNPDSAENIALKRAEENGIVSSISAGNSGTIVDGWTGTNYGYPLRENPDIGVVGSPGLNEPTISVASIENQTLTVNYLLYMLDGKEQRAPMANAGPTNPSKSFNGEVEYIYGGLGGTVEEIGDATGKIALIQRGEHAFIDKISNAKKAGAIGVIVFNNQSGGEGLINMQYPSGLEIPAVFIGHSDGMALKDNVEPKVVEFPEGVTESPNPTGGEMSDFTSWGTTPSLELKPEITAPGGQIYSTLNNDTYGVMSGTSMAAPHVAGGSALALEYIKETDYFNGISSLERTRFAKALLMNTAVPVIDKYDELVSPRRQGAGLMDLYGTVSTPVIAVDRMSKEAKIELKEFNNTTIKMTLTAHNFSDKEVGYKIKTDTLKDVIDTSTDADLNLLASEPLNAKVSGDEYLIIPANSSKGFEVIVDISGDKDVTDYGNMFVEGFITLDEITDTHPNVTVPFVGFYGEWDEPKIIDGLSYQDDFGKTYFDFSGFLREYNNELYFYDTEEIYMNPGTVSGEIFGFDNIMPILSFLRNAKTVNYKITDENGKELRNVFTNNYVTKNYIDGGSKNPYTIISNAAWDGKVDGKFVEDGKYFYEIQAKIDFPDAKYQTYKMPITIDTVGPEISEIKYNEDTRELSFKAIDTSSGLNMIRFMVDGTFIDDLTINAEAGKDIYTVTLPESVTGKTRIAIVAYDNIYNYTTEDIAGFGEEDPYIFILEPSLLEVYDKSEVTVEGYVTNVNYLEKVLIDGETEADIEFLENVTVTNPDDPSSILIDGPAYKFTKTITLEDGYKEMKIKAISENGKESSLTRRFYVDTTNPTLKAEVLDRDASSAKATIRFTMSDNLDYLRLLESDSQIFIYDGFEEAVEIDDTEKTFDYEVDLELGMNTFEFTLLDSVDHNVKATVEIERTETQSTVEISRIAGTSRFSTAVQVSKKQYDRTDNIILASSENYPDALASSGLSTKLKAPILLTEENKLAKDSLNEIIRLGAKNIYIVGGNKAINETVEEELIAKGLNVIRIAGSNRDNTAIEIGELVIEGSNTDTAIVVNGHNFPDTLSVGAVAGSKGYPIVFANDNKVSKETMDALKNWNIKNIKIIGGINVVGKEVETQLSSYSIERISGSNRISTSVEVAKKFFPNTKEALIANGYDFPDGLVGGPLAANLNVPILLTEKDNLPNNLSPYIKDNIKKATILGGPIAVNEDVERAISESISK